MHDRAAHKKRDAPSGEKKSFGKVPYVEETFGKVLLKNHRHLL
jgi:hypothetical protein